MPARERTGYAALERRALARVELVTIPSGPGFTELAVGAVF